jgi:hypothetical protein
MKVDLGLSAVPVLEGFFQGTIRVTEVFATVVYVCKEVVVTGFTQGVRTGVPGEFFGALVPIGDYAFPIDEIDTVVQVVDKVLIE